MKQRYVMFAIIFSILATMPVWGQTEVIKREPAKDSRKPTNRVGMKCYFIKSFSEGLAKIEINRKAGFTGRNGNIVIPCKWREAESFHEGLAWVQNDEYKWGAIDQTGNIVIPCQWRGVYSFHEGLAWVEDDDFRKSFIDKTGKEVISCEKYVNYGYYFSEGLVPIQKNGRIGYVDKTGELVIPFKWKGANDYDSGFLASCSFSEGMAKVMNDEGSYGFIDKTGAVVIPCKWEYAGMFSEGMTLVKDESGKYGYIDKKGEMVIPCRWAGASPFAEGLAWVEDENGKDVVIDKSGNVVVLCKWRTASITPRFHDGLARVRDNKNGQYGFIDKCGNVRIPFKWEYAEDFSEGLAWVRDSRDQYHIINMQGQILK